MAPSTQAHAKDGQGPALLKLPAELLQRVLLEVHPLQLHVVACTCRALCLAVSDERLWRALRAALSIEDTDEFDLLASGDARARHDPRHRLFSQQCAWSKNDHLFVLGMMSMRARLFVAAKEWIPRPPSNPQSLQGEQLSMDPDRKLERVLLEVEARARCLRATLHAEFQLRKHLPLETALGMVAFGGISLSNFSSMTIRFFSLEEALEFKRSGGSLPEGSSLTIHSSSQESQTRTPLRTGPLSSDRVLNWFHPQWLPVADVYFPELSGEQPWADMLVLNCRDPGRLYLLRAITVEIWRDDDEVQDDGEHWPSLRLMDEWFTGYLHMIKLIKHWIVRGAMATEESDEANYEDYDSDYYSSSEHGSDPFFPATYSGSD